MRKIVRILFKIWVRFKRSFKRPLNRVYTYILFYINQVEVKNFKTSGIPIISLHRNSNLKIGADFQMHNGFAGNLIGRPQRCMFITGKKSEIIIGNHVGMSSTALVAHKRITIGNYVTIGGGVCIYDTDFHSIDPEIRKNPEIDMDKKNIKEVVIEDNVFIGAHSTILKGVKIGENAIIGACSLISKDVPPNQIWAGNPARFIKEI